MAKRAKVTDVAAESDRISAPDLKRVIEQAKRQKSLASDYAGQHGAHIKNACERYGLDKTALTFARRLSEMEDGKRQSVIRASIDYWIKLGFTDQLDFYDDVIDMLRGLVERADSAVAAPPKKAGKSAVDSVLN